MDGVVNGDHTPYLIDLVNQGSIIIPDFDIPIPEIFIHPELPEHLYVPGSESATFSMFGGWGLLPCGIVNLCMHPVQFYSCWNNEVVRGLHCYIKLRQLCAIYLYRPGELSRLEIQL